MPKRKYDDPRLTPARPDLAAEHLRTKVQAARYVPAQEKQVCVSLAQLYGAPDASVQLQTELLLGERFDVYEHKDGWVWGQAQRDGYVGYVRADSFAECGHVADHFISALRTPIFSHPDLKAPVRSYAHGGAVFKGAAWEDRYVQIAPDQGWIFEKHTRPMGEAVSDWVANALMYENTPYLWGGRSSFGIDCSGLLQNALQAGGITARRDSDMQQSQLGQPVPIKADLSGLLRGDLVFWKGHVGLMLDAHMFLHANAHHMRVAVEPIVEAAARIKKTAGAITAIRRL